MAKKIYDIFPPNSRSEIRSSLKDRKEAPGFSSRTSIVKWFILLGSALLAVIASGYFFLLKVDIDIWPETQAVEYSGTIEVRSDHFHYDIQTGVIPGEMFVIEREESGTFLASGKETEERRAEGTLTVYNNYSGLPQTLVVETRFVSADGKLFRSTEAILIPGRSGSVPGQAEVTVRAVEPGEEYNIEKTSKFSIPGLQGTPMYTSIHAENSGPITGGFIGESPLITANDVATARDIILSSAIENTKKELLDRDPDLVFNEDSMNVNITTEFVRPEAGERYESFDYHLEAEIKIFAFKRSDMENFLKDILLSQLKDEDINSMFSGKEIWGDSLDFGYVADTRGMNDGNIFLTTEASAIAYPVIREELIRSELSGMTINEARSALIDYDRVSDTRIEPRPSWLKMMPGSDKIKIDIRFD